MVSGPRISHRRAAAGALFTFSMRFALVVAAASCGAANRLPAHSAPSAPPQAAMGAAAGDSQQEAKVKTAQVELVSSESSPRPVAAMAPAAMQKGAPAASIAAAPAGGAAAVSSGGAATARPAEMLEIEASIVIQVPHVASAAEQLRGFVKRFGGIVVADTVMEQGGMTSAQLTVRVPVEQTDPFLSSVDGIGQVRSRQINARDIGKEYYDAELQLENLRVTMGRYEDILRQAKTVQEILQIEGEITRLRGQIEQIEGNLRWMRDRTSRSTIHVRLEAPPAVREVAGPTFVPEAKLYPGLRLTELTDLRGEEGNATYVGGGLSLRFARSFALNFDGLRRSGTGSPTSGLDLFLASLGGEFYSDFFGSGERRYLNPFIGYTVGYARFLGKNEALAGVTAGVELVKTKVVVLEAQGRAFGMFLSSAGLHVAVQPTIGANIAF